MSRTKKGSIIFLTIVFCLLHGIASAQVIFKDQYLKTQADIAASSTYANIVEYMKIKKYKLDTREIDEEDQYEYLVFSGSFSQMVVVTYSKNKELLFIKSNLLTINRVFCESELGDNKFQKISTVNEDVGGEKWTEITWGKTGYAYQFMLEHVKENIGWMYLYTPALLKTGKLGQKEQVVIPKKMYDYSTLQKFADSLNAHLFSAELYDKASGYRFAALGKIDFEKRSIQFTVKNNELYVKMHLPKNGECDYGIQEVKAKFLDWGGALVGSNNNLMWVNFDHSYSCSGSYYTALHILLHKPNTDFRNETLQKLKSCCQ